MATDDDEEITGSIFKLREYREELEKSKEAQRQLAEQRKLASEVQRIASEGLEDAKTKLQGLTSATTADAAAVEAQIAEVERLTEAQREAAGVVRDLSEEQQKASKSTADLTKQLSDAKAKFASLRGPLQHVIGDFTKLGGGLVGITSMFLEQAHALNKTSVELARTTGYATAFHDNAVALADQSNGLNLSFAEGIKVVGALSLNYKDFNALNEQAQRELAETSGRFLKLGVDAATTATSIDKLENSLGMSRATAQAAIKDFERMSMELGQPLGQTLKDFNELSGHLARFGEDGKRVFKDLAMQARSLGVGVKEAFDVTELFDTFQSAAEVAGKLNAQLGMQLNSTEMMGVSSEQRLKILRAEFELQGTTFKDMDKRQKQMVAEILQTDVASATRLFGDPMEMRAMQRGQEDQAERLAKFTSAAEKLQNAFEQMFVKVEPILTAFTTVIGVFAEYLGSGITAASVFTGVIFKLGTALAGGLKGLTAILNVTKGLSKAMAGLGGVLSVVQGIFDYMATGDPIYGILSAVGSFGGMMAGAAIGSALFPCVGTILGGMVGSLIGGSVLKGLYGTPESSDVTTINDGVIQANDMSTSGGGYTVLDPKGNKVATTNDKDFGFAMPGGEVHRQLDQAGALSVQNANKRLIAANTRQTTRDQAAATQQLPKELATTVNMSIDVGSGVKQVSKTITQDLVNTNRLSGIISTPRALGWA